MPNLTRRQLSILLGVAAYVLLSVVIGILLRSRLSASGRISSILSEVGGSWHQELILSQSIFEAQRAGRAEKRDHAQRALHAEQERQDTRLRMLMMMPDVSDRADILRLYDIHGMVGGQLKAIAESRDISRPLEELSRCIGEADDIIRKTNDAIGRRIMAYAIFCWIWPLPLLGLLGYWLFILSRRRKCQLQTLRNYLSVPVGQLLEEPARHARRDPSATEDPTFAEGMDELLRRIRKESQSREKFIATMSHEIRTPMNGLLGFLSSLKETQLSDQQRQYLKIIDSSAKGLVHVINEILDFTKLRAGKLTASEVTFDLRSFAEERVALARQSARGKSLKVNLLFHGAEEPVLMRTDPSLLRQILDNLLGNGVKFTERGEVALEIQVTPLDGGRLSIDFAVRDSGIGMTQSEQDHLFKPYEQADISIARRYGGTGLGLTISHSLVELLGGRLQVKSSPGEGSCFYFTLQCAASKPEEQVHLSDLYHVKLPRTELKKHWALLVDDTLTNLFLLETICQSVGLPYRTAENGREALDLCRQQHFDLIFMDIQMPIMDGYTAIREIRKLPDAATTTIIALTASAYQEDVEKALGAGSTGFIPKPFERDQLLLCIAEALGITPERELRAADRELAESPEVATVRRMHDFMREQYQLSLGEIKMLLAQTLADWRPLMDNLGSYAQQGNEQETLALLHRLKGQLAAIGLLDHSEKTVTIMEAFREGRREEGQTMILGFIQSLTRIFKLLESDVTVA